ncbi:hypothetical protein IscW_ISCW017983 [Ixodes scapularis]|uniref:Uncharacterized protein n=1 Tax=Ixodes scapularis TaxID=6945 RepID=B7PIC7_IXOSC|nr:hypothetical protein IscW_ISCW017983 [Ixodes scapularis]|eukprot:XP_002404808.1 hypothetical protein IscW_ISCW017983 [Ixodes scapularis]
MLLAELNHVVGTPEPPPLLIPLLRDPHTLAVDMHVLDIRSRKQTADNTSRQIAKAHL